MSHPQVVTGNTDEKGLVYKSNRLQWTPYSFPCLGMTNNLYFFASLDEGRT